MTDERGEMAGWSKAARAALQVVGLVILGWAVWRQVAWTEVTASYRGISTAAAATVIAAVLAAMALRLRKWHLLIRAIGLVRAPTPVVARGFLLGVLLGAVTPLRLGEFYRVAAATVGEDPEARARAAAAVVLDKGLELLVVLTTLSVGAVLVGMPVWTCTITAAASAAIAWLVLSPAGAPTSTGPLTRLWASFAAARGRVDRPHRARLLAITAAAHALNLGAGLLIWRTLGALPVADYVVRIPLITLLNTLPVTIGGFGLRELAAIELFAPVGYPPAAAASAAAGLFFAANVLPALALLPVAAILARRRR